MVSTATRKDLLSDELRKYPNTADVCSLLLFVYCSFGAVLPIFYLEPPDSQHLTILPRPGSARATVLPWE